jgi:cytochrome c oxidase subunit IV
VPAIERKYLDLLDWRALAAVGIAAIKLAPRLVLVGRTVMDFSAHHTLQRQVTTANAS